MGVFDSNDEFELADRFDSDVELPTGTPVTVFLDQLRHWYREGFSAGLAIDYASGAHMRAAATRDPASGTVNGHGTANYDGINDVVAAGDVTTLDGSGELTAWGCFKGPAGQIGYATLLGKLYGGVALHVGANATGTRLTAAIGGNFGVADAESNANPFDNSWHRWIYVWDYITGGVLYVDGVAQTITEPALETAIPDVSEFLSMGGVTTDNVTSFDYYYDGEQTNVGAALRRATAGEISTLDAYLAAWVATVSNSTLSMRGVPVDARVGRAQLSTLATVAPRGAAVDARSGRAQITGLATIAPRGAHAEARVGRPTLATVATIAPIGVRARSAASSSSLSSAAFLSLRGASADARASAGYFTTATSIALVGAPADARAGRAQFSGANTLAPGGVPVDVRVGGASISTVATLALIGAQVDARSGRLQVAPGAVSIAPSGARVVVRASSGSATTGLIIAVVGVRGEALPGVASVASFYTLALRGARSDALASSVVVSTAYTVALRGVRARPLPGPATVAPGAVIVAVRGARADVQPGTAQVASFVTLGLSGVRSRALPGRATMTTAAFLALAGIGARARVGAATVVPGAVAVALRGVAARSELGTLVVALGGVPTLTLSLSGLRVEATTGSVALSALNAIALSGVRARTREGVVGVSGINILVTQGARSIARFGPALASSSATIAPRGVASRPRTSARSVSSVAIIAPVGVGSDGRPGYLSVAPGGVTIAPAGVRIDGTSGVAAVLSTIDTVLRLLGARADVQVGRLFAYFPANATLRVVDAPRTSIKVATTPSTPIVVDDSPATRIDVMSDQNEYHVGETAEVTATFTTRTGLTDPTTLRVDVKPPKSPAYTIPYPGDPRLVRDGQGVFRAIIDITEHGDEGYKAYWVSTGAAKGAKPWSAKTKPRPF